jgi:hypothetical protein
LEKPAFSGCSALGNALLLGLFALSDGLLGIKNDANPWQVCVIEQRAYYSQDIGLSTWWIW